MKIVALLSWFDEDPALLMQSVLAVARVGASHVIAVDGPYQDYAHTSTASPPQQHEALLAAARAADITMRICKPGAAWPTEMDKRTYMFRCADEQAVPPDYIVPVDADMIWRPTIDLQTALPMPMSMDAEAAYEVNLVENGAARWTRCIYKWEPGIEVRQLHHCYITQDGRYLWGPKYLQVPAARIQVATIDHLRVNHERRVKQVAYYDARDHKLLETLGCWYCNRQAKFKADTPADGVRPICGRCKRELDVGRRPLKKMNRLRELNAR